MQGRSETRLSNAETSATYLKCLNFSFFSFLFIFVFFFTRSLFVYLFFCFLVRSHKLKGMSALLTVQYVFFCDLLLDEVLRQTAAACDRAKLGRWI